METRTPALLLAASLLAAVPADALVYLNRQWDPQREEFVTDVLDLSGRSESYDRSYQNLYGAANCLCSGPPFIIERLVVASTQIDPVTGKVYPSGVKFQSSGAEKDPCGESECQKKPFEIVFQEVGDFFVQGFVSGTAATIQLLGSSSDPILLRGHPFLENWGMDLTGLSKPLPHGVVLEHVVVDGATGGGIATDLMKIRTGDLELNHSTFRGVSGYQGLVLAPIRNHLLPEKPTLKVRSCRFEDNELGTDGIQGLIAIGGFTDVVIDDNVFARNTFRNEPRNPLVQPFEESGLSEPLELTSIRDNLAFSNSRDAIAMTAYVPGAARIRTNETLPLVVEGTLRVLEDGDLTIEEGSVVKHHEPIGLTVPHRSRIQVLGKLTAHDTVFTSFADDSHGGDSDGQPQPDPVPIGGGIRIHPGATLELSGSTLQHLEGATWVEGRAAIRNSLFRRNSGAIQIQHGRAEIEHTVSRQNVGSGLGFRSRESGSPGVMPDRLIVRNSSFVQNSGVGVGITVLGGLPTQVELDQLEIASNGAEGLLLFPGDALEGFSVFQSRITSNEKSGFVSESGTDAGVVELLGNLIAGNGMGLHSFGGNGLWAKRAKLELVNNSVVLNRGFGLADALGHTVRSTVANNLFFGNRNYGLFRQNAWPDPQLTSNNFWQNNDGVNELYVVLPSGTYTTVESLQALGGGFATNQHLDPFFDPLLAGTITGIVYEAVTDESVVIDLAGDFHGVPLRGRLVNPNVAEDDRWFTIVGGSGNRFRVQGDVRQVAEVGDLYQIFDPHLAPTSDLIDAGADDALPEALDRDLDRDARTLDGDLDGTATVDIGADEYVPGSPAILADPEEVVFDEVAVGEASPPQPVTITNGGDGHLWLEGAFWRGAHQDEFEVSPFAGCLFGALAPGRSCPVQLVFEPEEAGEREAELVIRSSDRERPELAIYTSGTGQLPDSDEDGVPDQTDNCVDRPNGPLLPDAGGISQRDSDRDGYGNACDTDYDGNGLTGISDFSVLRAQFGKREQDDGFDPAVDANGDGAIGLIDFNTLRSFFGEPPGPSGLDCAGTVPCLAP